MSTVCCTASCVFRWWASTTCLTPCNWVPNIPCRRSYISFRTSSKRNSPLYSAAFDAWDDSDPKWIRYFVSVLLLQVPATEKNQVLYLFLVEGINLGCNLATIYEPLVSRYGEICSFDHAFIAFLTCGTGTVAALTFFPISKWDVSQLLGCLSPVRPQWLPQVSLR